MKSYRWIVFFLSIYQPIFASSCTLVCNVDRSNALYKQISSVVNLPDYISDLCVCSKSGQVSFFKFSLNKKKYAYEYIESSWRKSEIVPILHDVTEVVIHRSFYKDGAAQGIDNKILRQVESMFKDKIQFSRYLQKNDKIKFLIEHKATGDVVTMAKIQQKRGSLTAMRFLSHGHSGSFGVNGHALVEGFDRAPIKYRKISSSFRKARKHPILGYSRPHKGVDLAADSGTPIYATSSGQIVSLGALRGYGKAIIIKHKGNYETRYAHMHNYAKGLKVGDYVNRKQVIGYVGMTGLATAPHCHYEFRIGHVAYDPMTVKLPEGEMLSGVRLKRFQAKWKQNYGLLQG